MVKPLPLVVQPMSPPDDTAVVRRARRPKIRRPERTEAILDAAYALLIEVGYDRLTIDAIAARAHASKATIYQRWPGKRDLVFDAVRRAAARRSTAFVPAGAAFDEELLVFLRSLRELSEPDDALAFLSLLSAAQRDGDIAAAIGDVIADRRDTCREIVERAVHRGEIATTDVSASTEQIFGLIIGQIIVRQFLTGQPLDDTFLADLVNDVLLPVARRHGSK
jgi:AcrR family transcriptional regulator